MWKIIKEIRMFAEILYCYLYNEKEFLLCTNIYIYIKYQCVQKRKIKKLCQKEKRQPV